MATRESFSDKQLDKRTLTRRRDPLLKVLGPTRIFISYRVNESQDAAESVRKRLQKAFLPHSVFMDWNKIRTGEDFMRAIKHEISRSHIFILLISEKTFASSRAEDPILTELRLAANKKNIIFMPLQLDGFPFYQKERELPPEVKHFQHIHAVNLTTTDLRTQQGQLDSLVKDILWHRWGIFKRNLYSLITLGLLAAFAFLALPKVLAHIIPLPPPPPKIFTLTSVPSTVSAQPGGATPVTASCQPGMQLVDGGYSITDMNGQANNNYSPVASFPENNGWKAVFDDSIYPDAKDVTAVALCLKTNTTTRITPTAQKGMTNSATTVMCPTGSIAVGGGYDLTSSASAVVIASQPIRGSGDALTGWRITSVDVQSSPMQAYVMCAQGNITSALGTPQTVSVASNQAGMAQAACGAGMYLSGGGYTIPDASGAGNVAVTEDAPDPQTGSAWDVHLFDIDKIAHTAQVMPVCLSVGH